MTPEAPSPKPNRLPRARLARSAPRFVATTAAAFAAIVWTHALAGILRHLGPEDAPLAAPSLTLAAVLVALAGPWIWPRRSLLSDILAGTVAGAAGAGVLQTLFPGSWAAALALVPVGAAVSLGGGWLSRRLPRELGHVVRRRPGVALLWALLAVVALVQMGRLATFMTDPSSDWFLTTRLPLWAKHECLPAYFHGAELTLRGEDPYDPSHYPGLNREAKPVTEVAGMTPEDPYLYPPQFLLLPRLALTLTHDYPTLRLVWFGLQVSLFVGVAVWLALWLGGRAGRWALALLPAVLAAFPTLHNFQFGQFHLATVALAVAAFLCFESGRRAVGGALLATAVLAKMFPAVLLLPLLVRRRFRELAWTAGFGIAFTVVALAVLGPAPFVAFLGEHLPRLGNGAAFAFHEIWPEAATLLINDNQGPYGLVLKLGVLGVPGMDEVTAAGVGRVFSLAVLVLTFLWGRRRADAFESPADTQDRLAKAVGWLGILGLASLASPGAWGDYVPVTAVWLLTFLAVPMVESRRLAWLLAPVWLFQATLLGTMPIGEWAPATAMAVLSAGGGLQLLGLFGWSVMGRPGASLARKAALEEVPDEASPLRCAA